MKPRFLTALQLNDSEEVDEILRTSNFDVDTVFDVEDKRRVLASYKQGYWLPDYKLESSWAMGIHICMMHNAVETALVLLQRGAAVNRKPNGKTPLHVACELSHADCVSLLLNWGAKINGMSLSGHTPLHYCITQESVDCARQLILKGADVNKPSQNNDEETPLHTAARLGVSELVGLYAMHGANVNAPNAHMETPLITAAFWAMDAREQTYSEQHHLVCRMLLDYGANPNLQEQDKKTALHKASWNCDQALMQILLDAGANPSIMDMNGCAAIQYVLNTVQMRPYCVPYRCFQLLLNYGAARVYPKQFHKVLQICHNDPKTVEVLINSYENITSTTKWREAIPKEIYKRELKGSTENVPSTKRFLNHYRKLNLFTMRIIHKENFYRGEFSDQTSYWNRHGKFYDSLFAACSSPRSLQHLARCAIRMTMRCSDSGIKQLPVPPPIKRYILLEPEGIIY